MSTSDSILLRHFAIFTHAINKITEDCCKSCLEPEFSRRPCMYYNNFTFPSFESKISISTWLSWKSFEWSSSLHFPQSNNQCSSRAINQIMFIICKHTRKADKYTFKIFLSSVSSIFFISPSPHVYEAVR